MTVETEMKMSESTSLAQTQELIMSIFSCVGYLRDLFPEESFHDHKIVGMNLKKFKRGGDGNSDKLVQWIEEGCYDALSKKYLKSVILTILADSQNPNNVLETYTLRVQYPNSPIHQSVDTTTANIAQLSLSRNNKSVLSVESASPANFKENMSKILRSLCVMSQTLKALPTKKYLSMKLNYYEEVTPMGYEPPGFRAADFDIDHLFNAPTNKYSFGKTVTPYHSIGLSMETVNDDSLRPATGHIQGSQGLVYPASQLPAESKSSSDSSPPNLGTNTIDVQGGCDFNESLMIASQVAQASNSPPKFPPSQIIDETKEKENEKVTEQHGSVNVKKVADYEDLSQVQIIKCSCGHNVKELEMLQCSLCLKWQHAVCLGYVSCRDRRLDESGCICYYCRFGNQVKTFNFLQKLSRIRKALAVISAEGFTSFNALFERLHLSSGPGRIVRDRLLEDKFIIEAQVKGKKGLKHVHEVAKKDDHLKERIKFYFNQNLTIHKEFNETFPGTVPEQFDNKTQKSTRKYIKRKGLDQSIAPKTTAATLTDTKKSDPENDIVPPLQTTKTTVAVDTVDTFVPTQPPPQTPKNLTSNSKIITPPPSKSASDFQPVQKKRKISIPESRIACYSNDL